MKPIILSFLLFNLSYQLVAQTLDPGVFLSGGDSYVFDGNTMNVSIGEPVVDVYTAQGEMLTLGFNQPSLYEVKGWIIYDNQLNSTLSDTKVLLMNGAQEAKTGLSNGDGFFHLTDLLPGNYTLDGASTRPIGGLNSVDALLVLKHFAHFITLSGLRLKAADVDNNGYVTSVDALMVSKRYLELINYFPAGDWQFETPTIQMVQPMVYLQSFRAVCSGDVNGSNIP